MAAPDLPPDAAGARNPFDPDFVPAPTRAAATIILLRRGGKHAERDLEVLMVRRNPGARFMPGVWVFPGGGVEADELILGVSGAETDVDADELAHRAAAIRELREEAGIELARRRRAVALVALDHAGGGADPLRHPLLPGARPTPLPAEARRRRDRRRRLDEPRRRPRARPRRRARAGLPDDQAPRVAAPLRHRRRGDRGRQGARRRAGHAERGARTRTTGPTGRC